MTDTLISLIRDAQTAFLAINNRADSKLAGRRLATLQRAYSESLPDRAKVRADTDRRVKPYILSAVSFAMLQGESYQFIFSWDEDREETCQGLTGVATELLAFSAAHFPDDHPITRPELERRLANLRPALYRNGAATMHYPFTLERPDAMSDSGVGETEWQLIATLSRPEKLESDDTES